MTALALVCATLADGGDDVVAAALVVDADDDVNVIVASRSQ